MLGSADTAGRHGCTARQSLRYLVATTVDDASRVSRKSGKLHGAAERKGIYVVKGERGGREGINVRGGASYAIRYNTRSYCKARHVLSDGIIVMPWQFTSAAHDHTAKLVISYPAQLLRCLGISSVPPVNPYTQAAATWQARYSPLSLSLLPVAIPSKHDA